jgi:hypothetical protein
MYIFVAILLPLVGVCFADPGCNPAARVDCGYFGITKGQCTVDRGCCWNEEEENVPWCFYDDATKCFMYNIPRVECGFLGINEEQCKDRGCCWKESDTPGEPWCFKSGQVAERCDTVGMKTDCGEFI